MYQEQVGWGSWLGHNCAGTTCLGCTTVFDLFVVFTITLYTVLNQANVLVTHGIVVFKIALYTELKHATAFETHGVVVFKITLYTELKLLKSFTLHSTEAKHATVFETHGIGSWTITPGSSCELRGACQALPLYVEVIIIILITTTVIITYDCHHVSV